MIFLIFYFNFSSICLAIIFASVNQKVNQSYTFPAQPVKILVSILCILDARVLRLAHGISMLHFPFGSESSSAWTIHFSLPCPIWCQGSTNILSGICSCSWTALACKWGRKAMHDYQWLMGSFCLSCLL